MYDWLKLIHVLGAMVWVGGAVAIQFVAIRAMASKDPLRQATFTGDVEWLGMRVFTPASIIVLLAGIAMVLDSGIGFTPAWILAGFGGIAFTIVVGAAFLGPESGRLKKLISERGEADPEVIQRRNRIFMVSRIDLLVLIFVVAMMVFKPS
jgi:uncharacterized membrane protein